MEAVEPEEGDEDAEEVEIMVEDAEFEAPPAEEMLNAENWCHHRAHILKQGRAKPWAAPEAEEEEEPAEDEEEEEPEEAIPLLNGLEADALPKPPGEEDAEEDEDNPLNEKLWHFANLPEASANQVSVARNLSWPGSVAVCQGKNFTNVYVGWGQKYTPELYAPPPPPAVLGEYKSNFNQEEAEEGETDPMIEQMDPQPPKAAADEGDEGDEGEDEDE
jgi:radial spoke head protein 4A